MQRFSEATRTWFSASFKEPTPAQDGAWDAVARGDSALVVAPTGSGKTLSAFLWSIDRLITESAQDHAPAGPATRVLYISPLKALGVDIERNLRSPLVGIGHTARRLGFEPTDISVGVRTGDSTSKQRRDLVRNPPHILITTPESLYLMLTSQARATLANVDTVIIDEVHALAGTKRGAHLALSLERLDELLDAPAQRIGLSATVEPHDEVARFVGGRQPVQTIAPPAQKSWDITVSVPVPDMAAPTPAPEESADQPLQPSIWPHVEHKIVSLITANRSTIVFVNSRRLAEKLTGRINEIWADRSRPEAVGAEPASAPEPDTPTEHDDADTEPAALARSHHGSVSKDQRALIEDDLKSGRLRCVVATSSLELGIDMGALDLVIQVEAPHAVSAGLQRIGRAGHHVGEVSVGWFFPKHRGDLLSTALIVERMLSGQIEALKIPKNPLDVLAQQTVAASAMETLDLEQWFDTVRRAAPFTTLPRSAFEAVLDLLAGKYPSDRFADLRPRIIWDRDAGTIAGRPGAQRLAVTSGGTIPDRGLFGVYLVGAEDSRTGGRRVGELDEEMVYESRIGDVFALGATSWRIEEITFDRVLVSPAFGQPASLPFWRGDGIGRPAELGEALGAFARTLHGEETEAAHTRLQAAGMDTWARQNLLQYLEEQHQALGSIPSDTTLVVERTKDELGDWRIILHSPYGMGVHAPWALAVGERLHELYGLDGAAFASDDGIVLRVPMMDDDPPGAELFSFEPEELEELVTSRVSSSALFSGRFREAAARSLLLPRQHPGQRTPLWQQRQRSAQLLEVAHPYPNFPVIIETMREVLQDVYDLPALDGLIRRIAQRRVRLVESTTLTPSPYAQSILFGYIAQYLYEGDSPLAERRAAALSVDPKLLNELLGRVELREFLDPQVIAEAEAHAQRLSPGRRLTGVEGAADLLRMLGPLSAEQLGRRLHPGTDDQPPPTEQPTTEQSPPEHPATAQQAHSWAQQLVTAQRAFALNWQGEERFAVVEDASRLRDGLGVNIPPGIPQTFLEPVDDPLGDLLGRYGRTHAPFTADDAASALGLPAAVVSEVLGRLMQQGRIVQGLFSPELRAQTEYVETRMLRRIRRRSLAALRAAVEPVPPRAYAQLLGEWQSVAPGQQVSGSAGLAEVLAQLSGFPAPASAWESYILPARVRDYRPSMLDELLGAGEFVVTGAGALSGHDGWVVFFPAEDAELLRLQKPDHRPTETADRVQQVLDRGGAWFPQAVSAQLEGLDADQVREALWEQFWAGVVQPDSFAVLREFMNAGSTAHRRRSSPVRSRHTSRRTALRQAVRAARGESAHSGGTGGRWSLTPVPTAAATETAHTRAEILLDRYGVLTRGSVVAEQTPGGFTGVYKVLAAAEDAGRIRRGYFIEQLGAAQFTASATIDRLRDISERLEDRRLEDQRVEDQRHESAVVLAATDPANPYGAALDWPTQQQAAAKPGRRAGAVVVIYNGDLVLYMERGGRTMLLFTEEEPLMERTAAALAARLKAAGTGRLAVERVNGTAVLQHRFGAALRNAGFDSSPSGLRFSG
nr:ATP-dependent helicase [Garicola koreensis]